MFSPDFVTTFYLIKDTTLTAIFREIPDSLIPLTIITTEGGTTSPIGTSFHDTGAVVTIRAFADECYQFAY